MTVRPKYLRFFATAAVALVALGGLTLAYSESGRADCPGKIICPITGDVICKDRCPLSKDGEAKPAAAKPGDCCAKPKR